MANLDQNPVWNRVAAGPGAVGETVMGPSYSYADNIRGPAAMGVGSRGTISQLGTNSGAIFDYVRYMVSGPALGNRYFVNTGGACMAPDKSIQARHNYINNVSTGENLVPASMRRDLGGVASNFNGLIPGMLQDVQGLNPLYLFSSLAADSTPQCDCYACPTSGGEQTRFLTPSLSPDFGTSRCVKVDPARCIATREGFSDGTNYAIGAAAILFVAILIAKM